MTKKEAIEKFVDRDFHPIPQEWVKIVAEAKDAGIYAWPMWGTMWIVDNWLGEKLMEKSRRMVSEADEIDLEAIDDEKEKADVIEAIAELKKESISYGETVLLENYINEEMAGAYCVLDKDGNTTAVYICEIDDQYVIGVNGAGWNFYDGVWDKLYDLLGLEWHDEPELTHEEEITSI